MMIVSTGQAVACVGSTGLRVVLIGRSLEGPFDVVEVRESAIKAGAGGGTSGGGSGSPDAYPEQHGCTGRRCPNASADSRDSGFPS